MSPTNQTAVVYFRADETLRWSTRAGEFVLWVATDSVLTADQESAWTIRDFWQMREGDFLTITNRWADLPTWFDLHPLEVGDKAVSEMKKRLDAGYKPKEPLDGPNIWRVKAGDRLAWVSTKDATKPVKELLDFRACALVVGENSQSSGEIEFFGAPEGESLPGAAESATRAAFKAAASLGVPRTFMEDWRFGA